MSYTYHSGPGPSGAGGLYALDDDIYNSDSYHPLQDENVSRQRRQQQQQQQQQDHQLGGDADGDDESALTPSDGYFGSPGAGTAGSSTAGAPTSSQVPHVPDIWVRDPSLGQEATAESKAREAGRLPATQLARGLDFTHHQHGALPAPVASLPFLDSPPPPFGRGPSSRDTCYQAQAPAPLHNPWADPSSRHYHHHLQQQQACWSPSSSPSSAAFTPPWSGTASVADAAAPANGNISFPYTPSHQHQHPQQHHHHLQSTHPDHPPSDAPPAYSPRARDQPAPATPTAAPASRRPSHPSSPAQPQQGYQTFAGSAPILAAAAAAMPSHRQESQGLLAREPESMMGDLEDYVTERPEPRWKQRLRRRVPFIHSNLCRGIALGVVLFVITVLFLAASVKSLREGDIQTPLPPQESSVLGPPDPPKPEPPRPDPAKPAPTAYPPFDRELSFSDKSRCREGDFKRANSYSITAAAGKTLLVKEAKQKDSPADKSAYVQTYGDVVFRRAIDGDAAITVELKTNDERIVVDQDFDSVAQTLALSVPHRVPWEDRDGSPCLHARITVTVPEGAKLDSLQVSTLSLGVKFLDNLSMSVVSSTIVRTNVGDVGAAVNGENDLDKLAHHGAPPHFRFDSRYVSIRTTSADIVGSWPLYDLLALETTSGSIKAGVDPKPVDPEVPRDAKLMVKSTSGDVEFWEPVHQARRVLQQQQEQAKLVNVLAPPPPKPAEALLPPREYLVDIHTSSGKIKGAVAFTYSAKIRSTSGTVAVDLLPVLPSELAVEATRDKTRLASLNTSSTSGATALRVLDPFWIEGGKYSTNPAPPPPVAPAQPPVQPPTLPTLPGQMMPPLNTPGQDLGDPERGIVVPVGGGAGYNVPPNTGPAIIVPPGLEGSILPSMPGREALVKRQAEDGMGTARGPPVTSAEKFLRLLRARHSTTSADIGVRLPGCWEGDVVVDTKSGRIAIDGKGVQVIKKGQDLPGFNRHVVARKGDLDNGDGSTIVIQTASGDVDVLVGKA